MLDRSGGLQLTQWSCNGRGSLLFDALAKMGKQPAIRRGFFFGKRDGKKEYEGEYDRRLLCQRIE